MAKIEYVKNGLYSYCSTDINDIITALEKAKSKASTLSSPASFSYSGYISSLSSNIGKLVAKANKIDSILKEINKEYEELNTRMKKDVDSLDSSLVKERERLIE